MDHTFRVVKREFDWKFGKPFNLWFFGDVHRDSQACDVDRWISFLKKSAKDPDAYYLSMGDTHDFASAREQKALKNAGLHEGTIETFDHMVTSLNTKFCGEIKHMRGKLLGLIGGNHTWQLMNGRFADEDLAEKMGSEYLGWLCVIGLQFNFGGKHTKTLYIVACHGKGGGKLMGTSINKVDDMNRIFPDADLVAMGHDHQRGAWPVSRLQFQNNNGTIKIHQHRQYLIRSGSFLKSYEEDKSQYTVAGLMRPADLGAVKISITFGRSGSKSDGSIEWEIESTV